jgi:hypothetical protein
MEARPKLKGQNKLGRPISRHKAVSVGPEETQAGAPSPSSLDLFGTADRQGKTKRRR